MEHMEIWNKLTKQERVICCMSAMDIPVERIAEITDLTVEEVQFFIHGPIKLKFGLMSREEAQAKE